MLKKIRNRVGRAVEITIDQFNRKSSNVPVYVPSIQQRQQNVQHYQAQYERQLERCLEALKDVTLLLEQKPLNGATFKKVYDLLDFCRIPIGDLHEWSHAINKEREALEISRFEGSPAPTT